MAYVSISGANGDGCTNKASHNDTSALVRVRGALYAGGTCLVEPGTYTASARWNAGNEAIAALMVVELP